MLFLSTKGYLTMHYTIDYKGLTGRARRDKARADTKWFLGDAKYAEILDSMGHHLGPNPTRKEIRQATNLMGLCGVHGYPARRFALDAIRHHRNA